MAERSETLSALGVDVGSLFLKIVLLRDGAVLSSFYEEHKGLPSSLFKRALPRFLHEDPMRVGLTGALSNAIGNSNLTLIRLNARGELEGLSRNSLCAAGTGSFLDEQAARLGVCYAETNALPPVEDPPVIATRCAVFAKSDLIHHQQKGRTCAECWSGLCRGMVRTLLNTLLKGRSLRGRKGTSAMHTMSSRSDGAPERYIGMPTAGFAKR